MKAAFAVYPVTVEQLMDIADQGRTCRRNRPGSNQSWEAVCFYTEFNYALRIDLGRCRIDKELPGKLPLYTKGSFSGVFLLEGK